MHYQTGKYKSGQDALTKLEYEKVLGAIDNFQDELLIRLTVATGMRREDIVGVKVKDINFQESYLSFYEHKKRKIHTVYLPENIILLIQRYLKTIPANQEKLFDLCSKTAYNHFQSACVIAGVKRRPFHALRATCIKFCQANGWSMEQTATHVDDTIRVIQEHYNAPSQAEMKQTTTNKPFA